MRLLTIPTIALARCVEMAARAFERIASLCYGLLPALLPVSEISSRVIHAYDHVYTTEIPAHTDGALEETLDAWEADVLARYDIRTGRMLVLGSGWGRESMAIARRGISVIGIDTNAAAILVSRARAIAAGVPASFHRASLHALPYKPGSFDYALLASIMYSAIPGRAPRERWLRQIGRHLTTGGLAILSFRPEYGPPTMKDRLRSRINLFLSRLPGANHAYQPGDKYPSGHFMHFFQDEQEIRAELAGAGALVRELSWPNGYAVVSFSTQEARLSA